MSSIPSSEDLRVWVQQADERVEEAAAEVNAVVEVIDSVSEEIDKTKSDITDSEGWAHLGRVTRLSRHLDYLRDKERQLRQQETQLTARRTWYEKRRRELRLRHTAPFPMKTEDGVKERWLPDAARPVFNIDAKALLIAWIETAKKPTVDEDRDQHPAFHELLRLSLPAQLRDWDRYPEHALPELVVAAVRSSIHCSSRSSFLAGWSPDFSLVPLVYALSTSACAFIIELQLGPLDLPHKQRAVTYNTVVLKGSRRLFTMTAVTNLELIMFIRTSRPEAGSHDFETRYSIEYDVLDAGWEILLATIRGTEWLGQYTPDLTWNGQSVDIVKYFGAGLSSTVWLGHIELNASAVIVPEHWSSGAVVCKAFSVENLFERELSICEEIERRFLSFSTAAAAQVRPLRLPTRLIFRSSSKTPQQPPVRALSSPTPLSPAPSPMSKSGDPVYPPRHTLFFTPVGVHKPEDCNSQDAFRDMFSCLFGLRQLNIVHRDLAPRHFLRCDEDSASASRGLFLIDFGSAALLPDSAEARHTFSAPFCGSLIFAPTSVLAALAKNGLSMQYLPLLAHDLESLVKVCYACRYAGDVRSLQKMNTDDAGKIHAFWLALENWLATGEGRGGCWLKALQHARNDEFDETKKAMELAFSPLIV